MNELSLFSGAGGGLLGTKLLGFRPIGYVEWEPYCQAILAQRIKDGFLEEAPIFGDIREFVKSGAARQYRGFADVVTAGFPCQPFSVAGKQRSADDERNMWPATADVLREVRPRYALLENVPGLLATGYCERIFADLAQMGFDAKWGVFSAASIGAPHRRERLFILAHANDWRRRTDLAGRDDPARQDSDRTQADGVLGEICQTGGTQDVAHSRQQYEQLQQREIRAESAPSGANVAVPAIDGWVAWRARDAKKRAMWRESDRGGFNANNVAYAELREWESDGADGRVGRERKPENDCTFTGRGTWWATEPRLGRVANELADRLDFSGTIEQ